MHMPLRTLILIFGFIVSLAAAASLGIQAHAINTYQIGSPIYRGITEKQGFIADIVPPPINLVQPYALAVQSFVYHRNSESNLTKLAQLKQDYEKRKAHWLASTLPEDIMNKLKTAVFPGTDKFWNIVEGKLIPAIRAKDQPAIATAGLDLKDGFAQHQTVMEDLMRTTRAFVAADEALSVSAASTLSKIGTGSAILSILVLVGGLIYVRKRAILPALDMARIMHELSAGKLEVQVPHARRRDEIGVMAAAVEIFRQSAIARQELEAEAEQSRAKAEDDRISAQAKAEQDAEQRLREATTGLASGLRRLAAGELITDLNEPFSVEFEGLRHDFNQSVAQLSRVLSEVSSAASIIDDSTREISDGSANLSRRTEQQAASLEETAAALNDITMNVTAASVRAEEARTVAVAANQAACRSGEVVDKAISAMSRIENSSVEMSSIISAIDQIAFQTNLLALNAGVEAARAGEAGKGFAVVAQEVRELAQRSAQAAREITRLISSSNAEIEAGVQLVRQTGDALLHHWRSYRKHEYAYEGDSAFCPRPGAGSDGGEHGDRQNGSGDPAECCHGRANHRGKCESRPGIGEPERSPVDIQCCTAQNTSAECAKRNGAVFTGEK